MSQNALAEAVKFFSESDLISTWEDLSGQLEQLSAAERVYRDEITRRCFAGAPSEGTFYHQLADGRKVRYVARLNYSFVSADIFQPLYDTLATIVGSDKVDTIVVWKASLGLKSYRELTGAAKIAADAMLITKPAAPALSIETE